MKIFGAALSCSAVPFNLASASVRECHSLFALHLFNGKLEHGEGLGVAGLHLVGEGW